MDKKDENYKNHMENILEALDTKEGEEAVGSVEQIMRILMLDDEEFLFVNEIILGQIEKEYNSTESKTTMLQVMRAAGMTIQDMISGLTEAQKTIEETLADTMTKPKRDFLNRVVGITINSIQDAEGTTKKVINIPIERCRDNAKIPTYACDGDAGMDVYACGDFVVNPGETHLVPLGIKVAIPFGYELQVRPRSGMSVKTKLRVANAPGTIDSGYRDEICVIVENIENVVTKLETAPVFDENDKLDSLKITNIEYGKNYYINDGDRIAQLVLCELPKCNFNEVDNVSEIEGNRNGGFGHTGVN